MLNGHRLTEAFMSRMKILEIILDKIAATVISGITDSMRSQHPGQLKAGSNPIGIDNCCSS